jgi:nucleoside-diphosphate-sugar epimerase
VKVSGKIYNVGDNTQNFTIKKVANVVAEEIPGTTIVEEDRSPNQRSYKVNFDKISEELNFKAQFDLRKGIRELSTLIKNGAYGNMPLILGDEICVRR